jgi:hypothetical protein
VFSLFFILLGYFCEMTGIPVGLVVAQNLKVFKKICWVRLCLCAACCLVACVSSWRFLIGLFYFWPPTTPLQSSSPESQSWPEPTLTKYKTSQTETCFSRHTGSRLPGSHICHRTQMSLSPVVAGYPKLLLCCVTYRSTYRFRVAIHFGALCTLSYLQSNHLS